MLILGSGIQVLSASSSVLVTIPYSTDAATASSQLSAALGATPSSSDFPSGSCLPAHTDYDYSGFKLQSGSQSPGQQFNVHATASSIPSGVALLTPVGFTVGSSISAAAGAIPGSYTNSEQGYSYVYYDDQSGTGNTIDGWGVIAIAPPGSDAIKDIIAPFYFHGDC